MPQFPEETGSYATYAIRPGDSLWLIAQHFNTTLHAIMSANPTLDAGNLQVGRIVYIPQKSKCQTTATQPLSEEISKEQQIVSNHMRLLWEQHIYWTRLAILSVVYDLPDLKFVDARLLRNPKDFEEALRPFYGEDIAAEFAELLTDHLIIAGELVHAAKVGDSAKVTDIERRWYENADQIAAFLGEINPYWSAQEWREMLYDHIAMTKDEAVAIISQDYEESINIFEKIEQQALMMADIMTQGLVQQFPQYFR